MDEIVNDAITPSNYDLSKTQKPINSSSILSQVEYPKTQYIQFDVTRPENKNETMYENKVTYATCNICSTFKGEGHSRQLCGKYVCMKN